MKKHFLFIALCAAFILVSCGVKKNVADNQEPVASTLEQRIAAGEFAWLDTIPVDTEYTHKLSGTYHLAYQNDLYGQKLNDKNVLGDSLILLPDGYYGLYKNDSLVDYGKYNVTPYQRAIKICMEQYKTDPQTMMYTDEIITYEGYWGVWGESKIYFTFISYNTIKKTFLGLYSYSNNLRFKLHFDVKMGDCYHHQWSGSNQIEWIRTN